MTTGAARLGGRVDLLDRNLSRLKQNGKWTLASVTSAMNAAATQDVRAIDTVPLLQRLLDGARAQRRGRADAGPAGRLAPARGSRLDRDLDGKIDDPGRGDHGAAWPRSPTRS